MQRSLAEILSGVDVGAVIEQGVGDRLVTRKCRLVQRSTAVVVPGLNVCALGQQRPDECRILVKRRRKMQRCHAVITRSLEFRAAVHGRVNQGYGRNFPERKFRP